MLCPVCEGEYVAPTEVAVLPAGRNGGLLEVTARGVRTGKIQPIARGVILKLRFYCENHHWFAWTLQFHKGVSHLMVRCCEEDACGWPKDVIWRD